MVYCLNICQQDEYVVANPSDLWGRIQECEKSQMRAEAEKNNLKEKINDLNSRLSELNNSLRDKERTIQDLNKKLVSFKFLICLNKNL